MFYVFSAHDKEATKRKSDGKSESTENGKHDGEGDAPPAKVAKVDDAEATEPEAKAEEQPEKEKTNGEAEAEAAEAKAE